MDIESSMGNIASITNKIDEGQGTIGKLVNDDGTVNRLNDALDGINDTLGSIKKFQTEIGYHTEYLGKSEEFKHYVHLNLRPRPDSAFLLEFVSDPSPPLTRTTTTTDITANGATSTVTTNQAVQEHNKFLVSAQLAKNFYDFTLRGGIIESTGGVGLDYNKGPVGLAFSAYDFSKQAGSGRPHLKLMGNINLTKSIYVLAALMTW
jgi:phospholipid/cholesterol/gamma-HCH transport system substrate-binding protein